MENRPNSKSSMDNPNRRRRNERRAPKVVGVDDDVLDLRQPESSLLPLRRNVNEKGTMRVTRKQTASRVRDVDSVTDLVAQRILEQDAEIRRRSRRTKDEWRDMIPEDVDITSIVAQRIVNMQQSVQLDRFPYNKSLVMKKLEIRTEDTPERARDRSRRKPERERYQRTRDDTPTPPIRSRQRLISPKQTGDSSSNSSLSTSPSRPRFQLTPNPVGYRKLVRNHAAQVDIPKETMPSSRTQTDLLDRGRHEHVQIVERPNTTTKRVQSRVYKTSTKETDPVQHEYLYRSKFTNTNSYYESKNKEVRQQREYITEGDMVCIEWINRYLFSASLQPGRYVLDQKVREISEIGTKSTILTDFESW